MTRAEYEAIYQQARDSWPKITAQAMRSIHKAYVTASEQVTAAIARAEMRGLSELTTASLMDIQFQLQKAQWEIAASINEETPKATEKAFQAQVKADTGFLLGAVDKAGAGSKVTASGVDRMVVAINKAMVQDVVTRMSAGGYALKAAQGYEATIKDLIAAGLAQGLDPAQIAKQVTRYVDKGLGGLQEGVWGELKPGTRDYYKRLPKEIDWRALRIVRTEITMSQHSATVQQARMNAGWAGEFEWLRGNEIDWGCECPGYAEGSPYTLEELPSPPHPNCMCSVRPTTRPFNDFVSDLERWIDGEDVEYLDTWYLDVYQRAG